MARPSLVWLRDDLRIADNPALHAAIERGGPIAVVYLLDEVSEGIRPLGGASKWWLHHSLHSLADSLATIGGRLVLRRGAALEVIPQIVDAIDAGFVTWNRRYGAAREVDAQLKTLMRNRGVEVASHQANLLHEPWTITTGAGEPYKVFTPFWRACLTAGEPRMPLAAPGRMESVDLTSDALNEWNLLPAHPDWAGGLRDAWEPGEAAAHDRLDHFATEIVQNYHRRDEPGIEATSLLSPRLRFGELSPFQVWHRLRANLPDGVRANAAKFLSEVGWREFNWNILFHFPDLATRNVRAEFDAFPWGEPSTEELDAWRTGNTGVPLVDAGMRELWQTGYMHNRVRMVTASFLIKNLLVDWRVGERWFWDTLVDADEASNPGNWQWVAGSGADAAPYFRIFNPALQQKKFDPNGTYVKRWVPSSELTTAPIVDLAESRRDALAAYEAMRHRV